MAEHEYGPFAGLLIGEALFVGGLGVLEWLVAGRNRRALNVAAASPRGDWSPP